MSIKAFIEQQLTGVSLEPPVFYNAKIGIRFEAGPSGPAIDDQTYFAVVKERALALFQAVFQPGQTMYIVVGSYESIEPMEWEVEGMVDFATTFLNPRLKQELEEIYREPSLDEDTSELIGYSITYGVHCTVSDVDCASLLGAIGGFSEQKETVVDRIYFVDPDRRILFHMYDHRGIDIVASRKEDLAFLYHQYNDWILDYDREQIDEIFGTELQY
ncbi:DUF3885 domain-containing protein [Paenibacillus pinisoli]|uniref:DUF3885 domain-containing protein n=1 Tax=Paenibacillus pinisoli TaxID=1276110 RepID=A0A3A6Q654_9BACL|nr:DUF3885 domain-containing protein [Paenibacillus pinisoli]RJX41314.1 DUF3885 domain-containing protein [Paenibacillus pinisoli]